MLFYSLEEHHCVLHHNGCGEHINKIIIKKKTNRCISLMGEMWYILPTWKDPSFFNHILSIFWGGGNT